jgi:hypothetical protein
MVQGWIMDMTYGGRVPSQWVPGPPRNSVWTGTKLPDEAAVPIGAFRCASCGYLEHYARDEFAAR